MIPELRLIILGGFTVTLDNQPIVGLTSHIERSVCGIVATWLTWVNLCMF